MTTLHLKTIINSKIQTVFNASRNLDFHKESLASTNERIIAGKQNGLIEEGETVTWRGKHFGCYLTHKSLITQMNKYDSFTDEMVDGHFKSFVHHQFIEQGNMTLMIDTIHYSVPYGLLGRFFDFLVLKKYLRKLIEERNEFLKINS
ncbi:SRPBCC family protein [Flavobacterium oreochromis]|uniref:SRPBCC family protein n=1 Tax=Flavobacterium oreochromis TaxID=2906078 RepID=UPI001CE5F59D|nr:SRPBCC family protein [Flavobacterium oreochromis]QYS86705.1 SRPBCC family protein [Flavobacterium oreochromis]